MKIIVCTRDLEYGVGSVVGTDLNSYEHDKKITDVLVIGPKKLNGFSKKIKFRIIKNTGKYFITKEPNFAFKCDKMLLSETKKNKYDKIIIHFPINARNYGINILYRVHGLHKSIIQNYPLGLKLLVGSMFHKIYSYFEYKSMNYAREISFVSKKTMEEAKLFYPEFKSKFSYKPNSVDKTRFYKTNNREKQEIKRQLGIDDGKRNILYVGRLEPMKGILELIDILKEINSENIRLIIIGEGPLKNEIKKVNFVKYLGKVNNNEMYKYYNASDLFVLPSHYENSPMTILEARACGCRILASNVGDNKLILKKESIYHNLDELRRRIK